MNRPVVRSGDRWLSLAEVERKVSKKKSWIYAMEAKGLFPRRVRVGASVFWLESALEAWMQAQVDAQQVSAA